MSCPPPLRPHEGGSLTDNPAPQPSQPVGPPLSDFSTSAVEGFLRVALIVALAPLCFAILGAALAALRLLDLNIAHDVIGRGLGARVAIGGVITGIVALGVAGYGGFSRYWPRAALPLALSIASYFAAIYIL